MAEEITNESGKRAILTKVKEEPISDDEVICEPVAKSPKRSDQPRECVVKKEPKDDIPVSRSSSAKIKITIKATKEKHAVKIFKDATVKELKDEAAKAFKMPVEKVCLIYSGKLLKDSDVLSTINIEDGHILHLVIKTNVATRLQETNQKNNKQGRIIFLKKLITKINVQNINEEHQSPGLIGPNATIEYPNVPDPASSSKDEPNSLSTTTTSRTSYITRQLSVKYSNMRKKFIFKKSKKGKIVAARPFINMILLQRKKMDKKLSELNKNITELKRSINALNVSMLHAGNLLCTALQNRYKFLKF